jgi:hypothetical protein
MHSGIWLSLVVLQLVHHLISSAVELPSVFSFSDGETTIPVGG